MSEIYHIEDGEKSQYTDFKTMKDAGLEYIQEHGTSDWTNLNASDPGVTILDQVCYALTELGYCNEFPVKDILTRKDGTLKTKNQFYLPEEILTTSPLTINDYKRYVLDATDGVYNLIIEAKSTGSAFPINAYQVYLYCDPSYTKKQITLLCKEVFFLLNNARNINEIFLIPEPLAPVSALITGQITIENESDLSSILYQGDLNIRNFIFPQVVPSVFETWENLSTDLVYNGPLLKNGWIDSESLGEKNDNVLSIDISSIIQDLNKVISASDIEFDSYLIIEGGFPIELPKDHFQVSKNQLVVIDLESSIDAGGLNIICNGKNINSMLPITEIVSPDGFTGNQTNSVLEESNTLNTKYPEGKFRDLNNYYSIQNTFPEIFAVGENSISTNATDVQIAQSKQLKGYLTLFDQLLANQFSQLANIDKLFSFRNSSSGTPSDVKSFYATQDAFEMRHPEFPVPYKRFSPTYFYQSLYDVPNIAPLLRGNETFNFSEQLISDKKRLKESWTEYKEDPYNPYIHGLMGFMENEEVSLNRRNQILDHLLAQNGESPYIVDAIIKGSIYTGDSLKDQVIFKSLYLQNLGLLSYYRQKAYDYYTALSISGKVPEITEKVKTRIRRDSSVDFIFNSAKIDALEKLNSSDFINYSAVELKLNLLFGLRTLYTDFIFNSIDQEPDPISGISEGPRAVIVQNHFNPVNQALWMIEQRRGLFFIETAVVAQSIIKSDLLTELSIFDYDVIFLFPTFIFPESTKQEGDTTIKYYEDSEFQTRLKIFAESSLPANVNYCYHLVRPEDLGVLIPIYAAWHNSLRFSIGSELEVYVLLEKLKELQQGRNPEDIDPLKEIEIRAIEQLELALLGELIVLVKSKIENGQDIDPYVEALILLEAIVVFSTFLIANDEFVHQSEEVLSLLEEVVEALTAIVLFEQRTIQSLEALKLATEVSTIIDLNLPIGNE